MSADNWAICPRCLARTKMERMKRKQDLVDDYGKVPEEEYVVRRLAEVTADSRCTDSPRCTLREDYSIDIDSKGKFTISYSCACSACQFSHRFQHSQQLEIDDDYEKE